jgi:hypothetical protein
VIGARRSGCQERVEEGGGGFNFLASFRSGEGGKRGRKRKRII